jgi:hypothetical protein
MYSYEECLGIILKNGEYVYKNGMRKKLVIVPYTKEYFSIFNNDLMTKNLSKEDVKVYAKDNKYTVWEYAVQLIKGEVFKL